MNAKRLRKKWEGREGKNKKGEKTKNREVSERMGKKRPWAKKGGWLRQRGERAERLGARGAGECRCERWERPSGRWLV